MDYYGDHYTHYLCTGALDRQTDEENSLLLLKGFKMRLTVVVPLPFQFLKLSMAEGGNWVHILWGSMFVAGEEHEASFMGICNNDLTGDMVGQSWSWWFEMLW